MNVVRWGILGTGNIAHQFAEGLQAVPDAKLIAVASRAQESADRFGNRFNVAHRHGAYVDLVSNSDVDVVYVASPHSQHHANTLLALEAQKAVLCEKPFTINAAELRTVIETARSNNLFLMEAMWTRYFPIMERVRSLLADGVIGRIQMVSADFGFREPYDPLSRLYDRRFGGGALLDVGVYGISFASMVLGKPSRIASLAQIGQSQVDEQSGYLLAYDTGQLAVLFAAIATESPQEATIMGTDGMLRIHSPWWQPERLTVRTGESEEVITLPYLANGYCYEAMEVGHCLRAGKTESAIMPLHESLEIIETMDILRSQWDMSYPMD